MPQTANANGMYEIQVNGETMEVSLDDLIKLAQKGEAADQKFQEAAAIKKEVLATIEKEGQTIKVGRMLKDAMAAGDPQGLVKVMVELGHDEKDVMAQMEALQGGGGAKKPANQPANQPAISDRDKRRMTLFEQLVDEMDAQGIDPKTFMQTVAKERAARGEAALNDDIAAKLAANPEFAPIMQQKGQKDVLVRLSRALLSDQFVQGRAKSLDETAISNSARDASELVKRLFENATDAAGGTSLGSTPPFQVGSIGNPPKPIKRPPVGSDAEARGQYIEQRIAEMQREAAMPEHG